MNVAFIAILSDRQHAFREGSRPHHAVVVTGVGQRSSVVRPDRPNAADEKVVVNHDRQISAQKCRDTAPVTPGDPLYPYVGKYIKDLTLAQIKTMDCGYQQLPGFPEQEQIKGFRMVELKDVLNLVKSYRAKQVTLNIETKVEAGAPEQTAPRELFVRRVFEEIHTSGIERQVTIQSFDWGALMEMHRLAPTWPLVALTNYDFLQIGKPGASPWLGGIDVDNYEGDFVKAAAAIPGVTALSPNYGFPQSGKVGDPGFRFYPDQAMVSEAHARGLKVIPWTCDDPATLEALMDMGVDGIITNYPNHVRQIMAGRGMRLPKAYAPR
ncbi:glycerophosphodiester phosphodiesterase family protein [Nonomuraea sp. NPDC049141]|uniref:glycerophosphodiester phosphodiesterase family protein n=1 Tax=Nonomuraea sp. NPDC049141 TaxID=3155500 RepID=UPI0033C72727